MNKYAMREQFGRKPSLEAVLVYSLQQALKAIGSSQRRRSDPTRSLKAKARSRGFKAKRIFLAKTEGRA